jgi:two-component system, cell cycle sensor histidine kinase and response regulator CckA
VAPGEAAVTPDRRSEDEPVDQEARILIHDFRNLLAVIVNYSELIALETDDPAAVRADIQEVRAAAERAILLTDKLPRTSRRAPEPPAASET